MAGFFLPSLILLSFFPLRAALIGGCASKCRHTNGRRGLLAFLVGYSLLAEMSSSWEIDGTSVRIEEEGEED